jgi:hypothetical protein
VESIGWLKIYGQNYARESGTVDFHSVAAIDVIDYDRYCEGITLIGSDVFHGILKLYQPTSSAMALPTIQGFSEVDSLYISMPSRAGAEGLIPGFRKVNRGVYLIAGSQNAISFSLPDMEEIGGSANISIQFQGASATATAVSFPKLKSVGGNFTLTVMAKTAETLTCPELTTVGGNFILYTDYDMANGTRKGLKTVLFPKLATVGGKLTVRPSSLNSASYVNAQLTDLNGFAALRSVQAVEIAWMTHLTDYSGLQGAFTAAPWGADNWSATGNDYNPTYQDFEDGKWTKE